jgi:hypothetical protein
MGSSVPAESVEVSALMECRLLKMKCGSICARNAPGTRTVAPPMSVNTSIAVFFPLTDHRAAQIELRPVHHRCEIATSEYWRVDDLLMPAPEGEDARRLAALRSCGDIVPKHAAAREFLGSDECDDHPD